MTAVLVFVWRDVLVFLSFGVFARKYFSFQPFSYCIFLNDVLYFLLMNNQSDYEKDTDTYERYIRTA